jgi:ribonuclease HII
MARTRFIVGADEVGLGSLAGPLLCAAALVPVDWTLSGLRDSKKLSHLQKERLEKQIVDQKIPIFFEWRASDEIDRVGLGVAHRDAMSCAIRRALEVEPAAEVIVDGILKLKGFEYRSEPKADTKYPAVMCAAVMAKQARDRFMRLNAAKLWPEYDFEHNVGYYSEKHIAALDSHGTCPIHRLSFAPAAERARRELSMVGSELLDHAPDVAVEDSWTF